MAKKKKDKEAKKARAEQKMKKSQAKAESKDKKRAKKLGDEDDEDMDIEEVLANFKKEQEQFEKISVESVERLTKRVNPCMIANPSASSNKKELLFFGGEYTNPSTSTTTFYNDLYTFTPDNNQWKRFTSQNSPMPRSSAAMAAHSSGIALLHGGEFSSPKQNTFYHYSDSWVLDCNTKEWSKIDSKVGPSARSGHRITVWKNFFILHGGFRDLGTSTTYLGDCWLFDITTYKWKQVEFPPNHPLPDARSGHSLIPTADGAILWGGYCKIKANKKGYQKGKILSDCWYLKMKSDISGIRWERRKKQGFQPSARVGCSMAYHKNRGILFGGVYDYEETEESLESEFFNDLFSYQVESNRWYSLSIKSRKHNANNAVKKSGKTSKEQEKELKDLLDSILQKANLLDKTDDDEDEEEISNALAKADIEDEEGDEESAIEHTILTQLPHPRFNATTAVVDDSLFIYGGIWEQGDKDFMVDSLYSIDLNKIDGVTMYWEDMKDINKAKELGIQDSDEEDDDEDDDEEDDDDEEEGDDDDDEEEEEEEEEEEIEEELEYPDPRPWLPHPKAFESLRDFYVREGPAFLEWAISNNRDARGKHLKKHSFDLCQDRWWERRDQLRIEEDKLEELGAVGGVVERDTSKSSKRR
ncbi:Kelch repeat-containing protein 3 [Nakaseomyces bracarensis]|uniref:Kelch repeat-containing protein 3 n=1 Tax=Nakaseomyces bracarensis TaxID=273131 RepID=A0ABR4NSE1_9SACH